MRTSKINFQNFTDFSSRDIAIVSTISSEIGNFRLMEATWRLPRRRHGSLWVFSRFLAEYSRSCLLAPRSGKNGNKVSRTYYKLYRFIRIVCCEAVDITWWTSHDCEIAILIAASSSSAGLVAEWCQEEDIDFPGPLSGFLAESSRSCLLAPRSGKNGNKAVEITWWMLIGTDCEIAGAVNASLSAAGLVADYGPCWEWKGA